LCSERSLVVAALKKTSRSVVPAGSELRIGADFCAPVTILSLDSATLSGDATRGTMRSQLVLVAAIAGAVFACSEDSEPQDPPGSGGSVSAGQGGAAGASGSTTAGQGGAGTSAVGGSGTAGKAGSGGSSGTSGASGTSGEGGTSGANAGTSGASSGGAGGGGGVSGSPAGGVGGTPGAGGTDGGGTAGASGSGGGGTGNTPCTRELLSSTTDAYFTALEAHDPSTLPFASNAKFTENGEEVTIGEEGLWQTAGALVYKHSALDVDECSAMSQAVVPDGNMDIPLALRLKLVGGEITEIETIAVRPGDYSLGQSDTDALAASANSVNWEDPVPEADRATREEIIAWMDKYFRMFPAGVCDVTSACRRIENGGGNFMCTAGAQCSGEDPGPEDNELTPRLILADVERGIGVGFTMFQGNTDMHMFKMHGGEVHGVSAVLGQAGSSGWD
jgi:hypothetical protein